MAGLGRAAGPRDGDHRADLVRRPACTALSLRRRRLCGIGIKSDTAREEKLAAAIARQPSELLVGSSRVKFGFASSDAQQLLSGRVFNLGFNSASLEQESLAIREMVRRAPVERVWLALEAGGFMKRPREDEPLKLPADLPMAQFSWRAGLASPMALEATVGTLIRPRLCTSPPIDQNGFFNRVSGSRLAPGGWRVLERLEDEWHAPNAEQERSYAKQIERLRALARWLRERRVALVLFLSPMSDSYRNAIERAGITASYRRCEGMSPRSPVRKRRNWSKRTRIRSWRLSP